MLNVIWYTWGSFWEQVDLEVLVIWSPHSLVLLFQKAKALRVSYTGQLAEMAKVFQATLTADLPLWPSP